MFYWLYFLIVLLVTAVDQWTKHLIVTRMELNQIIPLWGSFFSITSHRNRGAAWGILQDQRLFFIIVTIVVIAGLVYYLFRKSREGRRFLPAALALLLGGALGNFIDRVRTGEVVDFFRVVFDFHAIGIPYIYHFPIFNVADAAITVGVALIILDTLLEARREKKRGAAHDSVNG